MTDQDITPSALLGQQQRGVGSIDERMARLGALHAPFGYTNAERTTDDSASRLYLKRRHGFVRAKGHLQRARHGLQGRIAREMAVRWP